MILLSNIIRILSNIIRVKVWKFSFDKRTFKIRNSCFFLTFDEADPVPEIFENFEACNFEACNFEACNFEACNFEACNFEACNFEACNFEACNFGAFSVHVIIFLGELF